MKKLLIVAISIAVVSFSQASFGWSRYMAHRVVSEDISRELRIDKMCLRQTVATYLGISLDELETITSKELGRGGIDLPDDSEKSKQEYTYLYTASSHCPKL